MTEEQKFRFDLHGYIVLQNVVPKPLIDACNIALDRFENMPETAYPDRFVSVRPARNRNCIFRTFSKVTRYSAS